MALMDYKVDQGWCNRCSNCKFIPSYRIKKSETMYVCPSITEYNFHAYSGSGKLEVGYSINDGHTKLNDTTKQVAYRCTLCGACDYTCKVFRKDIDVTENIEELRKECVSKGFIYPEHQAIIDSIRKNGNRSELTSPKVRNPNKSGPRAYHPSCPALGKLQIEQGCARKIEINILFCSPELFVINPL